MANDVFLANRSSAAKERGRRMVDGVAGGCARTRDQIVHKTLDKWLVFAPLEGTTCRRRGGVRRRVGL
ncbi:2-dehydropantoate 2-reductase [Anopheles sinensis]|uniref:2-dehydropantoate 2-reductase n=1 Tax=Anopheles sinensis TaxID=74873 RepID=A0A084VX19_ANOSI|nr:2-dehydropantoate 2-reductase [Anopheles sinensis]